MNDEIKEILDKCTPFLSGNEVDKLINYINYITNLEHVAAVRMNLILKIEQYLIDSGVDDEILECCDIYAVNGVELRKYIEKLKNDGDE